MIRIVDDFMSTAGFHYLQESARNESPVAFEYEGLHFDGIIDHTDMEFGARLIDVFRQSVSINLEFSRLGTADIENPTFNHNDHNMGTHTAILYLNPPENVACGTSLWRHRRTQWTSVPPGQRSDKELMQRLHSEGFNESLWETELFIPMRENRLICFPSDRFHSQYPYQNFGTDSATGRLVHIAFVIVASEQAQNWLRG